MFQKERSGSVEESLGAPLEIEGGSGGTVFKQENLSSASVLVQSWKCHGIAKNRSLGRKA